MLKCGQNNKFVKLLPINTKFKDKNAHFRRILQQRRADAYQNLFTQIDKQLSVMYR